MISIRHIPFRRAATLLLRSLAVASCHFLDEKPKDQLDESQLITDARSLYLATLGDLYAHFGSDDEGEGIMGTGRGIYDLQTITSDEAIIPIRGADWNDGGLWIRLYTHAWESGEAPVKNAWNYLFQMIVKSNKALQRVENYASLLTPEEKASYTAELQAIRAYMYYYLLDLYARVPLITGPDVALSDVAQSERSEVFDFVVRELEAVREKLPLERSNYLGNCYGRITRPVVFLLLAKLNLNADVYMDDDWTDGVRINHPECYKKCMDYCDSITVFPGEDYHLSPGYTENFSTTNERSHENILTIPMDPDRYASQFQYVFRSLHYDHAAALGMCGENGPCATWEVLDANHFGLADEDPRFKMNYWGGAAVDANGKQVYLNKTTPLVYKPESVELDLTGNEDEKVAGARMKKYDYDPNCTTDGKMVHNDLVIFRYADVLLMRAEAMARYGEDPTALVNMVRARVEAPLLATAGLDDILRERLLELCWEGHRRQDMVRFGVFGDARRSRAQLPGEENGYTTVFPIPADAIAVNHNLEQNKGYE